MDASTAVSTAGSAALVASVAWCGLAVLLGALLALGTTTHRLRAGALGAAAVAAWTVGVSALDRVVPWLGPDGADAALEPGTIALEGPDGLVAAVAAASVLAGALAVGRRPVPVTDAPRCSRLARIVVLGLVVVGAALTAALLAWAHDGTVTGSTPIVPHLLMDGVVPAGPLLLLLAWRASGRHPSATVTSVAAVGVLLVALASSDRGVGHLVRTDVDPTTAATVLAAGITAVVTTFLAADRRAACDALGRLGG